MSLQHERVVELCNELRLGGVAAQYSALAQKAAEKHTPRRAPLLPIEIIVPCAATRV